MKQPEPCCNAFAKALESGTDNEAWSHLIWWMHDFWKMGADLPPLAYCPWCGKKLKGGE